LLNFVVLPIFGFLAEIEIKDEKSAEEDTNNGDVDLISE